MSLSYGTITGQATIAAANQAFLDEIEADLTAHAAWDFVEGFVASNVTYRVWKCLGTLNSDGVDFFVLLGFDSVGGAFHMGISEQYNSADNTVNDYAMVAAGTSMSDVDWTPVAATYTGWQVSTFNNRLASFPNATIVSTATFDYVISVTNNHLLFATTANVSWPGAVAGVIESFISPAKPTCFVAALVTTANQSTFSRQLAPLSSSNNFAGPGPGSTTNAFSLNPVVLGANPDPYNGKVYFSRIAQTPTNPSDTRGRIRGLLHDLVRIDTSGSGVVIGDTVELNGEDYRFVGSHIWVREAAA